MDIFRTKEGSLDMKCSVLRRGLRDIRTMSERISDVDNPQRKYLQLAMLGLEKARRNKEKQSASQRVANIDKRLREIAVEQATLLAAAKTELDVATMAKRRCQAATSPSGHGFELSY
jgi:hypothetical protein